MCCAFWLECTSSLPVSLASSFPLIPETQASSLPGGAFWITPTPSLDEVEQFSVELGADSGARLLGFRSRVLHLLAV